MNFVKPERENDVSKYHKKTKIGPFQLDALIDPDSSDCTIKASLVLEHNFNFIRVISTLTGFRRIGNEVKSTGIIRETVSVDECEAENVAFRVVPDDVQPYGVIIGRNFTELPHVSYYKADDKLVFVNRFNFIFNEHPVIESQNLNLDRAYANEIVGIPGASINFVNVKLGTEDVVLPLENKSSNNVRLEKGTELHNIVLSIEGNIPEVSARREPIVRQEICVCPTISPENEAKLLVLLNKYRECSALNELEIGLTKEQYMNIIEVPGSEPVYSKPYKASAEQRAIMRKIVSDWKEAGFVKETNSAYASPCLLVKKSDGSYRLVVDFRRLNKQTVRMNFLYRIWTTVSRNCTVQKFLRYSTWHTAICRCR